MAKTNECPVGPVLQVPHSKDIMMHTRNCKRVHDYLNKNHFDMDRLELMVNEHFGEQYVLETKAKLEKHFNFKIKNLKDYFEGLDSRVAELKHAGGGEEMIQMQRQECFILANNFIGDDERPGNTYLSRMVVPFSQILSARVIDDMLGNGRAELKYLIFNLHDTNISNFLRFLGYWEKYGYAKHVKFGSSVRLELLKMTNMCSKDEQNVEKQPDGSEIDQYLIRFVYDDEEIHLPFCKNKYCRFEEFATHVA
mmetsp:Transcript_16585/g.28233  ORF Transcript_16585/g.28233 Transcript_16585/m.28233 type:complete len:252 (+) Transcript_16585:541-1296(+)